MNSQDFIDIKNHTRTDTYIKNMIFYIVYTRYTCAAMQPLSPRWANFTQNSDTNSIKKFLANMAVINEHIKFETLRLKPGQHISTSI